jgi:hypothetical protein
MRIFECEYCLKKFSEEHKFVAHTCKQKERAIYLETKKGKRAFYYYCKWMKALGRKVPVKETFVHSKYFIAFQNFIIFEKKMLLPTPEKYIDFMVSKNVLPILWCKIEFYQMFMTVYDDIVDPIQQVQDTIKFINRMTTEIGCQPTQFFSFLYVDDLYKLIQTKKLSPWFLLNSKLFFRYLKTSLNSKERIVIDNLISINRWSEKFLNDKEKTKQIKDMVTSFGF